MKKNRISDVTRIPDATMKARFRFSYRRCMKFPPMIVAFNIMKTSRKASRNQRGMWNDSAASMATVMTRRMIHVTQYTR
jgi:hypothetical protein